MEKNPNTFQKCIFQVVGSILQLGDRLLFDQGGNKADSWVFWFITNVTLKCLRIGGWVVAVTGGYYRKIQLANAES